MTIDARESADFITRMRAGWTRTLPELDTMPVELIGRMTRIGSQSTQQLERVLEPSGVSRSEFDVLCALARSERSLRASEATAQTMLSAAATTKLTARLESAGFLVRRGIERDRRVVMLELTEQGRRLVEVEIERCLAQTARLLDGLDDDELATLAALLRKISDNAELEQLRMGTDV